MQQSITSQSINFLTCDLVKKTKKQKDITDNETGNTISYRDSKTIVEELIEKNILISFLSHVNYVNADENFC